MDFSLTHEQELIRASAREFCEREVAGGSERRHGAEERELCVVDTEFVYQQDVVRIRRGCAIMLSDDPRVGDDLFIESFETGIATSGRS